jgi:hypothetical protein
VGQGDGRAMLASRPISLNQEWQLFLTLLPIVVASSSRRDTIRHMRRLG